MRSAGFSRSLEGSREDKESWSNFLRYLKERGLKGVRLIVSDKCLGLYEIIGDFFPEAKWQRCYCPLVPKCFYHVSVETPSRGGGDA